MMFWSIRMQQAAHRWVSSPQELNAFVKESHEKGRTKNNETILGATRQTSRHNHKRFRLVNVL